MKCCPVVPEIFRGQVHVPKKERRKRIIIIIIIIIIIKKRAKTNKSPKRCLGDLISKSFSSFPDWLRPSSYTPYRYRQFEYN